MSWVDMIEAEGSSGVGQQMLPVAAIAVFIAVTVFAMRLCFAKRLLVPGDLTSLKSCLRLNYCRLYLHKASVENSTVDLRSLGHSTKLSRPSLRT